MVAQIRNFDCSYGNSVGISREVTAGLGLEFPDAYKHADTMVKLAMAVKEHDEASFVLLPFCRTVEVEAMGADINYGDENTGPRARDLVCKSVDDLLALPEIDFTQGRIFEEMRACRMLADAGEHVCLEIVGPWTMMQSLMEPRLLFKAWRKDQERVLEVMNKLGDQLLREVDEARKAGVEIITYSDSAGTLNILGPKVMEQSTVQFTAGFCKKLCDHIDDNMIIQMCPKIAYALVDTGMAEIRIHEFGEKVDFLEAMLSLRGKVKMMGQACIKNIGVSIANGKIREMVMV